MSHRFHPQLAARSAMVLALGVLALGLSACGGSSDTAQIKSVIRALAADHTKACNGKYVTSHFLGVFHGQRGCLKAVASAPPTKNLKIGSIKITGSSATAHTSDQNGSGTSHLVKQGGRWKVNTP